MYINRIERHYVLAGDVLEFKRPASPSKMTDYQLRMQHKKEQIKKDNQDIINRLKNKPGSHQQITKPKEQISTHSLETINKLKGRGQPYEIAYTDYGGNPPSTHLQYNFKKNTFTVNESPVSEDKAVKWLEEHKMNFPPEDYREIKAIINYLREVATLKPSAG